MKFVFFCTLLFLLWACQKPSDPVPTPNPVNPVVKDSVTTNVSTLSLNGALNSSDSVNIQTAGSWNVSFVPNKPSWLSVSSTSGSGDKKLIITITEANNSGAERKVVMKITSGTASADVTISQRVLGTLSITVFAGAGGLGTSDGVGQLAWFAVPTGITATGSGNLFVCDLGSGVIRKITPSAVVSTFVGTPLQLGNADGNGKNALFRMPFGICADKNANLYVADYNNKGIRKITPAGDVITVAGQLSSMTGVAADTSGNLYVVDPFSSVVRKISPSGQVSIFAGDAYRTGSTDGTGTDATFNGPGSITIAPSGNIYVLDWSNRNVRKITPAGVVTTVNTTASFIKPRGICVDKDENLYIADADNNAIKKIDANGNITTLISNVSKYYVDANYRSAYGIAVDENGVLWISNTGESTILKVVQ
jgi:streptogramin lyase